MNRKTILRSVILNILIDFGDHAAPHETLLQHLNMRERPRVELEDFNQLLQDLEDAGYVNRLKGKFADDGDRWFITESGRVSILQH